jgi:hypothetical protein
MLLAALAGVLQDTLDDHLGARSRDQDARVNGEGQAKEPPRACKVLNGLVLEGPGHKCSQAREFIGACRTIGIDVELQTLNTQDG